MRPTEGPKADYPGTSWQRASLRLECLRGGLTGVESWREEVAGVGDGRSLRELGQGERRAGGPSVQIFG